MKKQYIIALLCATTVSAAIQAQSITEVSDSLRAIVRSATDGNAEAQNIVGGWFYEGKHVTRDYEQAFRWWSKSAKSGNAKAIGNVGLCYQLGRGVEADSLQAVQYYTTSIRKGNKKLFESHVALADKGNVFSNVFVGESYIEGLIVERNRAKAIPYLRTAAEKGSVEACVSLARALYREKRVKEAALWTERGALKGNAEAEYLYGMFLIRGWGVAQNAEKGADYLFKAAEARNRAAMELMGDCYMSGTGVVRNEAAAVNWYMLAAGAGSDLAQMKLADCFRKGIGTEINYDRALYWYAEAYRNGHRKDFEDLVKNELAGSPFEAYMEGLKAVYFRDFAAALKCFKKVEKAKIPEGRIMTAVVMCDQDYAKHNVSKGIKILNKELGGNCLANYFLALIGEELGQEATGVDDIDVYACMSVAALCDYGPALCHLGDMFYEGRIAEQSYGAACESYARAFELGQLEERSARRYADCLRTGRGVKVSDKCLANRVLASIHTSAIPTLLGLVK